MKNSKINYFIIEYFFLDLLINRMRNLESFINYPLI